MLANVTNYFKNNNIQERKKNLYIKIANVICRSESSERVKYNVDIEKLSKMCYDKTKDSIVDSYFKEDNYHE